ncbi:MAG TPA: fluoride efflux transporter CrcB [Euryarchaeota archaeon]|nr:fluoride efflux transporter CrcB [Euryarchaeota archaeon]
MQAWLLVGLGGFIGAVARFLLSDWLGDRFYGFPAGTFAVNVLGSLLLGIIVGAFWKSLITDDARFFLGVGIMGAFTTMSAFSYEAMRLPNQGEYFRFSIYSAGSVVLCIMAVSVGYFLTTSLAS